MTVRRTTRQLRRRLSDGLPDRRSVSPTEVYRQAMQELVNDDAVQELWEEYEARETPEARFVKDMDLIDMALQALVYESDGRYEKDEDNPHFNEYEGLDEFMDSARTRIRSETAEELFEKIVDRYEKVK